MDWINMYGLAYMFIIMIPNIIFAANNKEWIRNSWNNRVIETFEQIGRFGCFVFMIFIIPGCGFGFTSDETFALYLILNTVLIVAYCIIWILYFKKLTIFRTLALSIIPSSLFIISGMLSNYLPLLISSVIFAPCHILISYKNEVLNIQR